MSAMCWKCGDSWTCCPDFNNPHKRVCYACLAHAPISFKDEKLNKIVASVAQMEEQKSSKLQVVGSSPTGCV